MNGGLHKPLRNSAAFKTHHYRRDPLTLTTEVSRETWTRSGGVLIVNHDQEVANSPTLNTKVGIEAVKERQTTMQLAQEFEE